MKPLSWMVDRTILGIFMLVLSRKKDESIVINNDIRIVVVEIRGDKVRLGVEAPKEIPVHRSEVYEAISCDELPNAITAVNNAKSVTSSREPPNPSELISD